MSEDVERAFGPDRRTFIKRLVVGAAFAAPVVSSFTMSGVQSVFASTPGNAALTPNVTPPPAPPNFPTNLNCYTVNAGLDVTVPDPVRNASLHLVVPNGALPDGTSVCIFRADLSALTAVVPSGQTPVSGYAVKWTAPGGGHPDATSPITLTVTDGTVVAGDPIFVVDSGSSVPAGNASGGTWTVTFTVDPDYVVTHAAATAVEAAPSFTG